MTSSTPPHKTRFQLNLPGFTVELAGERHFVEDLYRKISRDLTPVLTSAAGGESPQPPPKTPPRPAPRSGFTWVYLCTSLFNKVYVVDNTTVEETLLSRYLDGDRLRRIYIDRDETALFTGLTGGSQTLWAEFTTEGRALLRDSLDKLRPPAS